MVMTTAEIVSDYRQAKNKQRQITILAGLNLCSPREIAELLRDNGQELTKLWMDRLAEPARGRADRPEADPSVTSASGGDSSLARGAEEAPEDGGTPGAASPAERAESETPLTSERIVPAPVRPRPEGGITVGKLRELLASVPDATPVLLDMSTPLMHVLFTSAYDAETDTVEESLMLSPF